MVGIESSYFDHYMIGVELQDHRNTSRVLLIVRSDTRAQNLAALRELAEDAASRLEATCRTVRVTDIMRTSTSGIQTLHKLTLSTIPRKTCSDNSSKQPT